MNRKIVSGIMLALLLIGILTLTINIQPVKASGTIYIRPNGDVDPPTAPIQRDGDIYTFIGNISDSIVVERDNIVLDGAGYTVEPGPGGGMGIDLSLQNNITVKNTKITGFYAGIYLLYSNNNKIFNNTITNSIFGIYLWYSSSNNKIFDNTVSSNGLYGIEVDHSSNNNTIYSNKVVNNPYGIFLAHLTVNNNIFANTITSNDFGIMFLHSSSNNTLYHNNFIDNSYHAFCDENSINVWDNDYPSGGNYWSDYDGVDECVGPGQNITGRDGIGDTAYIIDENNQDNYPLMEPYVPGNLSVSIYTDKGTYNTGDTMYLGLNISNPDSVKYQCFAVWCELPDSSIYPVIHQHSVVLLIGLEYSNPSFKVFTLPSLLSGTYTWRVALLDRSTHAILVEDTAEWTFS